MFHIPNIWHTLLSFSSSINLIILKCPNESIYLWNYYIFLQFMGLLGGYHAGRLYKTMKGRNWKKAAFLTSTLYPGIIFSLGVFVNFFIWGKHSSGAMYVLPLNFETFCQICSNIITHLHSFDGRSIVKTWIKLLQLEGALMEHFLQFEFRIFTQMRGVTNTNYLFWNVPLWHLLIRKCKSSVHVMKKICFQWSKRLRRKKKRIKFFFYFQSFYHDVVHGRHVVWNFITFSIHRLLFRLSKATLRSTSQNKPNSKTSAYSNMVHESSPLYLDGRSVTLRRLFYWTIFHIFGHLWEPILLFIWIFVFGFRHPGRLMQSGK